MVTITIDNLPTTLTHTDASFPQRAGHRIKALKYCKLISVELHSESTATRCLLYTSAGVLLTSASFVGKTASFDYSLTENTEYYLEADKSGVAYNVKYREDAAIPYPLVGTNISYIAGSLNEADEYRPWNIISVTTEIKSADNKIGSRYLKTSWDELTASDSTKAIGHVQSLVAEQSFVPSRYMIGL